MNLIKNYGEYLIGKRIERGFTIKQLSQITKVPERNLFAIESEKIGKFSLHDLHQYLKVLNILLSEVMDD